MIYLEPEFTQKLSSAFQNTQYMFLADDRSTGYFNLVRPSRSSDGQGDLFPETLEAPLHHSDSAKTA